VGVAVGVAVGDDVGAWLSPAFVGAAVGAAVGAVHAVNTCVAEAPLEKVYGPATTANGQYAAFRVQDAPFQPSA
jgi:hypothetical protein